MRSRICHPEADQEARKEQNQLPVLASALFHADAPGSLPGSLSLSRSLSTIGHELSLVVPTLMQSFVDEDGRGFSCSLLVALW